MRIPAPGAILFVVTLGLAGSAQAQVGASASWQSDYRYRGRTLSAAKPALAASIAYDHSSGAYAGATAAAADTATGGLKVVSHTAYGGYVRRLRPGYALDGGVIRTDYIVRRNGSRAFHATEVYGGLLTDHLSARVHYSPDYFEPGFETLYADFAGSFRPTPDWRLFAHVGVLEPLKARLPPFDRPTRYDFSAGIARRLPRSEISLTWTRIDPFPVNRPAERDAGVLAMTVFF